MNILFEKLLCVALIIFLAVWVVDMLTANDILSYKHKYISAGLFAALAGSLIVSIRNIWDIRQNVMTANNLSGRSVLVGIALLCYLGVFIFHTERTLNPSGPAQGLMAVVLFIMLTSSLGIVVERIRAKLH